MSFPWESTSIWFLYMERVKWIIRFSSYFISFPHFPHGLGFSNQNATLLHLFIHCFHLLQWLGYAFSFKRLSQHFFHAQDCWIFMVAGCLPYAMAAARSSKTEWPGSPSESCQCVFLFLLLTCEHMWKEAWGHHFLSLLHWLLNFLFFMPWGKPKSQGNLSTVELSVTLWEIPFF